MQFKEAVQKTIENTGAVAMAIAKFFGDKFGNPNPIYPADSMTSIEDNPKPIPGNDWK